MKPPPITLISCLSLAFVVQAQEEKPMVVTPVPAQSGEAVPASPPSAPEVAIPEAFPQARYEASWKKNPFLLKTAPVIQVQESWAKDFVLASLAEIGGVFRVSIRNKVTGESKRLVQGEEGDGEYKVVSVNLQPNRKESSVELSKGAETATLKYDETQLVAQARANPAGGQPGARAGVQVPGMPNATGVVPNAVGARGREIGGASGAASRTPTSGSIPGRMTPAITAGGSASYPTSAGYNSNVGANRGLTSQVPAMRNTYSGPQPVNPASGAPVLPNSIAAPNLPVPSLPGATAGSASSTGALGVPVPLPGTTAPASNLPTTPTDPLPTDNTNSPTPERRRRSLIPAPTAP